MLSRLIRRGLSQKIFPKAAENSTEFSVKKLSDHFLINGSIKVTPAWLRDHCRSGSHYNHRTYQRKNEFPVCSNISSFHTDQKSLRIHWEDGHKSNFDLDWIHQVFQHQQSLQPKTWSPMDFPGFSQATSIDFTDYINTTEGLKRALGSLIVNGFTIISGSPVSLEAGTVPVATRIGPVMPGLYNGAWEVSASNANDEVSDTAYTNLPLEPHNDGTYHSQSPGLQLFHILKQADFGGENTLVDGFNVAKEFKQRYPEGYQFLSRLILEAEYIHTNTEPREHVHNKYVTFKHDSTTGKLEQFQFNGYDRAPHTMSLEEQQLFYEYYPNLGEIVKANVCPLKLEPGQVLVVDNWRVMHGRTGFKGHRILTGCYVDRDSFMSRAKSYGIHA